MIRPASWEDIPRIVDMGLRFLRESEYSRHLGENAEQMAKIAGALTAAGSVLVSERDGELVGMLGFVLYPHFLSGALTCGEVFWWVEPEHRGEGIKLLRAAEARAIAAGAKTIQMIAPNDRVAGLYKRLHYEFIEATYQRVL